MGCAGFRGDTRKHRLRCGEVHAREGFSHPEVVRARFNSCRVETRASAGAGAGAEGNRHVLSDDGDVFSVSPPPKPKGRTVFVGSRTVHTNTQAALFLLHRRRHRLLLPPPAPPRPLQNSVEDLKPRIDLAKQLVRATPPRGEEYLSMLQVILNRESSWTEWKDVSLALLGCTGFWAAACIQSYRTRTQKTFRTSCLFFS